MKVISKKNKSGQNTAEYLVMLILIAVGSIGVFTAFGATLKKHVNNAVIAFTGDTTQQVGTFGGEAVLGKNAASGGHGMNLNENQVKRFDGTAGANAPAPTP